MNRREEYADDKLWRETCRRQKRRYYGKTATFGRKDFTPDEDKMILEKTDLITGLPLTDTEISYRIGHSVSSIQSHRSRLKSQKKAH